MQSMIGFIIFADNKSAEPKLAKIYSERRAILH